MHIKYAKVVSSKENCVINLTPGFPNLSNVCDSVLYHKKGEATFKQKGSY